MDFTLQSLCQVLDCKGGKGSNVAAGTAGAAAEAIGLHALRETGTINLRQSGGSAAREKGGRELRIQTLSLTIRNHYTTFLQP